MLDLIVGEKEVWKVLEFNFQKNDTAVEEQYFVLYRPSFYGWL
ncbi:Uncharacterised protein [Myroides odoratus]|uniref:Uncharacterized protein n=1 Tax=Myroides odoratus TaxID=256 RepID=A0A378RQG6_MYROD|nr:Uncharacterised protein [Myroides odoratus]